jgi:hypothetical protein
MKPTLDKSKISSKISGTKNIVHIKYQPQILLTKLKSHQQQYFIQHKIPLT